MSRREAGTSRRGLWRLASAAPAPFLLAVYGIWTDLVTLDGSGFHVAWSVGDFTEWLAMAVGTGLLVVALWSASRPVRVLACAVYSLALAFGCGAAGVVTIVHALGGPGGNLHAPGWALVVLGLTSTLCAFALLALAALLVDDIRAADAGQG